MGVQKYKNRKKMGLKTKLRKIPNEKKEIEKELLMKATELFLIFTPRSTPSLTWFNMLHNFNIIFFFYWSFDHPSDCSTPHFCLFIWNVLHFSKTSKSFIPPYLHVESSTEWTLLNSSTQHANLSWLYLLFCIMWLSSFIFMSFISFRK